MKKCIGLCFLICLFSLSLGTAFAYTENYHDPVQPIAAMEEGEFSLAVLGDTQCVVEDHPDYFINTNRWLAEQAETLRLSYFLHMGDMVDDV